VNFFSAPECRLLRQDRGRFRFLLLGWRHEGAFLGGGALRRINLEICLVWCQSAPHAGDGFLRLGRTPAIGGPWPWDCSFDYVFPTIFSLGLAVSWSATVMLRGAEMAYCVVAILPVIPMVLQTIWIQSASFYQCLLTFIYCASGLIGSKPTAPIFQ